MHSPNDTRTLRCCYTNANEPIPSA